MFVGSCFVLAMKGGGNGLIRVLGALAGDDGGGKNRQPLLDPHKPHRNDLYRYRVRAMRLRNGLMDMLEKKLEGIEELLHQPMAAPLEWEV